MKKGVTLISLIIVIVITLLLAGIVVYNGSDITSYSNMTKFATEILNIQNSVDDYYYINNTYPAGEDKIFTTTNIGAKDLEQFQSETITDNNITFKTIDFEKLGIKERKHGNNTNELDSYVLSETTGKVYYLKGYEYKQKMYYTIDNELYNMSSIAENSKLSQNDIKRYDVIFSVSNTEYTAEPIEVTVKLPIDATINSVTTTNNKSKSTETRQAGYKVVNINKTSENKEGNYTISVNYTFDGVAKIATYEVTNFDNTAPVIVTTETIENGIKIINITISDTESGIKYLKYENSLITDMNHFVNFGKVVNNNVVKIQEGTACTIYVQDNAGNSVIKTIE